MEDFFDGGESLCVAIEGLTTNTLYTNDKVILLDENDVIMADFKETLTGETSLIKDTKNGDLKVHLNCFLFFSCIVFCLL
jgi:hypothetical protein